MPPANAAPEHGERIVGESGQFVGRHDEALRVHAGPPRPLYSPPATSFGYTQ